MNWPLLGAALTTVTCYFGPWPYYISAVVAGIAGMIADEPVCTVWSWVLHHGALASMVAGDDESMAVVRFIMLHLVSLVGVVGMYMVRQKYAAAWTLLWWACVVEGLTNDNRVGHLFPLRVLLRLVLFFCADIASRYGEHSNTSPLSLMRWSWIFFVHEVVLVCLPVPMIYDVYYHKV